MQDQSSFDTIEIPIIYIEVFVLMFVSFLIGYIFAFYYQKSKYSGSDAAYEPEDLSGKSFRETAGNEDASEHPKESEKTAKGNNYSIKVQDKKSIAERNNYLDFNRLGHANKFIKDDLQRIAGIGPFTEEKLNDIGIYTYAQISNLKDGDIQIITELIRFFPDRIKNDKWTEQAKMFTNQNRVEKRGRALRA